MDVHKELNVNGNDSLSMKNAEGRGDAELGIWQIGDGHYLGKSSLGENDEETGLATGTISNDDEFAADFRHYEGCVEFSERIK